MAICSIKKLVFESYILELLSTYLNQYNSRMSKYLKINTGESNGYSPPNYWKRSKAAVIDINNDENLTKWETVLNLSRKELIEAINLFGPVVIDIRRGLLKSRDEAA